MYTLELLGFGNFKRINCKTIEQARKEFAQVQKETYKVHQGGQMRDMQWSAWELLQNGQIIKTGEFKH